ncbi:MAG: hypothetical protein AAF950_07160 [Pseudomonadota bacterium]
MQQSNETTQSGADETLHLLILSYEDAIRDGDKTDEQLALQWEGVELYAETFGLTPYRVS